MDKYQEKILGKSTTLLLSSTFGDGSCSFVNNALGIERESSVIQLPSSSQSPIIVDVYDK